MALGRARSGQDARKAREGALSPWLLSSPCSGRPGLQPRLSPPLLPPSPCPCLAGTHTLLPTRLPLQPPLASQSPPCCHSVPTGMPSRATMVLPLGRARGPAAQLLAPPEPPSHGSCARAMQAPPALPMPGHPGIEELVLGAPLHPRSGLRARHRPSAWVTLLPAATSQGWGWDFAHPPTWAVQQRVWDPFSQSLPARCRQAGSPAAAACSQGLSPLPAPPRLSDLRR